MKKIFITLIGVLSFTVDCNSQQCTNCDPTRVMSSDPAYLKNNPDPCSSGNRSNTFDWYGATPSNQAETYLLYKPSEYTGNSSIPSPFYPANINDPYFKNYLYDIGTGGVVNRHNKPQDGWELIRRDFGYFWDINGNNNPTTLSPVNVGWNPTAYLILYNKYTSVIRILGTLVNTANVPAFNPDIQIKLSFRNSGDGTGINWKPTALFNHYSADQYFQTVSQSIDMPTVANSVMATAHWEGDHNWFFADFIVAYDPCTCNNSSAIDVTFNAVSTGSIQLGGMFYGVNQPITTAITPVPDPANPNGTNNMVTTWLSSASVQPTQNSGQYAPVAGMQTFGLISDVYAEYENQLSQYTNDQALEAQNASNLQAMDTFLSLLSEAVAFALVRKGNERTEGSGDSGSPGPRDYSQAINGVKDIYDFFSSGAPSSTEPPMPFITQGEMTLSGTVTFSNTLNQNNFSMVNPGSLNSGNTSVSNGIVYPEFTTACYSPTYPYNCVESNALPAYTYYNLPLGNFAVLTQPVIHHRSVSQQGIIVPADTYDGSPSSLTYNSVGDIYNFQDNTLQYIYNPAVPVDLQKSSVLGSLMIEVVFPTALDASFYINPLPWNSNFSLCSKSGFTSEFIKTDESGLHYRLSTDMVPLNELSTLYPSFTRLIQPHGHAVTSTTLVTPTIGGVYVKIAASIIFQPDPKYPGIPGRNRVLIATYPVKIVEDNSLPYLDPLYNVACTNFILDIAPATYTSNTIQWGSTIYINASQTVQANAKASYFSCTDIYVTPTSASVESVLSGEFILVPSYSPGQPLNFSNPNGLMPQAYSSVNCSSKNSYLADTLHSTSKMDSPLVLDNPVSTLPETITFTVSPNPSSGKVTLAYQTNKLRVTKLYITDMMGNTVRDISNNILVDSFQAEQDVDLSALTSGMYLCIIEATGHKEVKKLILVK
jgi:hypothetical protein